MRKKVLAMLLAAVLAVGLLPGTVFAAARSYSVQVKAADGGTATITFSNATAVEALVPFEGGNEWVTVIITAYDAPVTFDKAVDGRGYFGAYMKAIEDEGDYDSDDMSYFYNWGPSHADAGSYTWTYALDGPFFGFSDDSDPYGHGLDDPTVWLFDLVKYTTVDGDPIYVSTEGMEEFFSDIRSFSGTCGDNLTWDLTDGVLTISGTGAMDDYELETAPMPWVNLRFDIQTVVIEDGVTYIGTSAFDNSSVTDVTVPASVTSIGKSAFGFCYALTDINIADGNTSYVFEDGVLFNTDKTVLHTYLATNSAESYTIPDSVTTIVHSAFAGCMNLTSVVIPDGVTAIDVNTFGVCIGLAEVTIPADVTSIGDQAFFYCDSLTDVYYGGTKEQWGKITIGADNEALTGANIHYTDTEPEKPTFTDVKPTDYYADPVAWAVEQGITNGKTDTTFEPGTVCTRRDIITFLWRAYGEQEPTGTENPFTDVKPGDYYYKAVLWAVENGIVKDDVSAFNPKGECTRRDAVTMMYRAAGSPAVTGGAPFTDVKPNDYYADPVAWAVANGVTDGTTDTTFSPQKTCTRGQIVTFLYRQETKAGGFAH